MPKSFCVEFLILVIAEHFWNAVAVEIIIRPNFDSVGRRWWHVIYVPIANYSRHMLLKVSDMGGLKTSHNLRIIFEVLGCHVHIRREWLNLMSLMNSMKHHPGVRVKISFPLL
jgi:hypothetical protein